MIDLHLISAIDENYAAFQALLPALLHSYQGQYALLRDGRVEACFADAGDAALHGNTQFADGLFSIQEVMAEPSSLGYFSYAYDIRPA
jgi:hypothetical protein